MKRWSERSDVERMQIYTRATLYLMLWAVPFILVPNLIRSTTDRPGLLTVSLVAIILVAGAGTLAVQAAMELYPARGPVPWPRVLPVVILAVIGTGLARLAPADPEFALLLIISMVVSWSLGGFRDRLLTWTAFGLAILAPFLAELRPAAALMGAGIATIFVVTVRLSLWTLKIIEELDAAKGLQAALAVAEERLRFSRDVHDVLGGRLSTIAIQAELGSALAARGDERATEKMLEVRNTAHLALREARELARGYRTVDLTQEIDGARSLLRSAGITLSVDIDDLPTDWHEPAAWVVRESVTNVLRHSCATTMTIEYDPGELRLRNDGAPEPTPSVPGAGLLGLRERLAPLAATLETRRVGDWFQLTARLPGAVPPDTGSTTGSIKETR
ncbi:MAG: histidine kinase [Nocardioides sp.]|nr:histidine kinase [Nocardioides sp.]